ncbi:MAG: class I SAM-dependent methyltransferase [Rhodothermales bacterium]|nr:class I SAM-dependent methyltransferase [Rhodothermales bacterium]
MFDFHLDKERYFEFQYLTARDHIIPFIDRALPIHPDLRVLEIGCAEAGVLKAFLEKGCECVGVELSASRTEKAIELQSDAVEAGRLSFINKDVYDIDVENDLHSGFDLIILKDVIEHIPRQDEFVPRLVDFLNPGGMIFFGFPPWRMPFGGHQQMSRSKVLSVLPYFHLLPRRMYSLFLDAFGEDPVRRDELLEIHDTRISIQRFERIVRDSGLIVAKRHLWLLNPIYKYKFGKGPVAQLPVIRSIPVARDFVTTAAYYLVAPEARTQ